MKDVDKKRTKTLSIDDHDVGSDSIGITVVREGNGRDASVDEEELAVLDLVLDDEELREICGILEDCDDCDDLLIDEIDRQDEAYYNNKLVLNLQMQQLPATVSVYRRLQLTGDEFLNQDHIEPEKYRDFAHSLADLHNAWETLDY